MFCLCLANVLNINSLTLLSTLISHREREKGRGRGTEHDLLCGLCWDKYPLDEGGDLIEQLRTSFAAFPKGHTPEKCLPQAFCLLPKRACMGSTTNCSIARVTWCRAWEVYSCDCSCPGAAAAATPFLLVRARQCFAAPASGIRFFNKNLQSFCIFVFICTL